MLIRLVIVFFVEILGGTGFRLLVEVGFLVFFR